MVGGRRPHGAWCGARVTMGTVPWSPAWCCRAGVGSSSTNSTRSTRRRVRSPGIVLLSEGSAAGLASWDLNPAGVGAAELSCSFPRQHHVGTVGAPGTNNPAQGKLPG